MTRKRDYRHEYDAYQGTEVQKKHRAERNKARRELEREGKVRKGDGKDVAHKKALDSGGSNAKSNWAVQSVAKNRGWRKGKSGYKV